MALNEFIQALHLIRAHCKVTDLGCGMTKVEILQKLPKSTVNRIVRSKNTVAVHLHDKTKDVAANIGVVYGFWLDLNEKHPNHILYTSTDISPADSWGNEDDATYVFNPEPPVWRATLGMKYGITTCCRWGKRSSFFKRISNSKIIKELCTKIRWNRADDWTDEHIGATYRKIIELQDINQLAFFRACRFAHLETVYLTRGGVHATLSDDHPRSDRFDAGMWAVNNLFGLGPGGGGGNSKQCLALGAFLPEKMLSKQWNVWSEKEILPDDILYNNAKAREYTAMWDPYEVVFGNTQKYRDDMRYLKQNVRCGLFNDYVEYENAVDAFLESIPTGIKRQYYIVSNRHDSYHRRLILLDSNNLIAKIIIKKPDWFLRNNKTWPVSKAQLLDVFFQSEIDQECVTSLCVNSILKPLEIILNTIQQESIITRLLQPPVELHL